MLILFLPFTPCQFLIFIFNFSMHVYMSIFIYLLVKAAIFSANSCLKCVRTNYFRFCFQVFRLTSYTETYQCWHHLNTSVIKHIRLELVSFLHLRIIPKAAQFSTFYEASWELILITAFSESLNPQYICCNPLLHCFALLFLTSPN